MKKEKAITLIALIVTIIVLLILAGISIAILSGENGILSKAKIAKESSDLSTIEEQNKLGKYNESLDTYSTSRSLTSNTEFGERVTLWEGDVNQLNQTITLSDSIENYKYLMIKDRWFNANTSEIRWIEVNDIKNTGYFTSPTGSNSHMIICPYYNYYIFISFTSNKTLVIPEKSGDYVHIAGVYGIK